MKRGKSLIDPMGPEQVAIRVAQGARLRGVREKMGVSQLELARRCNLYQRDVSLIEKGVRRHLPTSYLRVIATACDLSAIIMGRRATSQPSQEAAATMPLEEQVLLARSIAEKATNLTERAVKLAEERTAERDALVAEAVILRGRMEALNALSGK